LTHSAASDDRQRGGAGVGHPHVVLELGHVLLGRSLFRERPREHELGLEHGVEVVDEPIEGGGQEATNWVLNPALDIADRASGVPLIPRPVQRLSGDAELDDEIVAEVLGLHLAALLLPQPKERGLISAHDDPCIRTANETGPVIVLWTLDCDKMGQFDFHENRPASVVN
jgi:hypothetical protein